MTFEDEEILKKIRIRKESIIKNGTYNYNTVSIDNTDDIDLPLNVGMPPDVEMPPLTEDFIQNNIDELIRDYSPDSSEMPTESGLAELSAEDAKIAEIMNMFSSNIQDNVSKLFDNL